MAQIHRKGKPHRPRVMRSGDGDKLYKHLTVKVIVGDKTMRHQFVAPAGNGYSEVDIEGILERAIEYIDKKFPKLEFKQVCLGPNAYNYIATGERETEGGENGERRIDSEFNDGSGSKGGVRETGTSNRSVAVGKT